MASDLRRAAATLASGVALAAGGAVLVLSWQAGWWATQLGALLCLGWIVGLGCWSALRRDPPIAATAIDDAEADAAALRRLLDQVPVPLVRVEAAGARAINRGARALFATDDRILPVPSALLGGSTEQLLHEGRSWRVDAVETAPGRRLAVLIDVEAEERAAERRAADEMIEILGHELLNGLSPIVSLADSAVTAAAQRDAMLPDILATLSRRVEGLEAFTRAYRTLSRLPDPVASPVALDALSDDLARLFRSRFGETVALSVDVPRGVSAVMDRDQMTQAVWALLQNAAEAALVSPAAAWVDLGLTADDGNLTIRVADSGSGIAAADRARIFRPFFTTKPQGSGIGLSLARRIARAHGGELRLLSTAETAFELRVSTG